MATRAEWFRYNEQRAGPKRPKRKVKAAVAKPHNVSDRAARKALYALEDRAPGKRPSRKSSRKASNRQKTDAQFRMKREAAEVRPSSPATRGR